MLQRKTPLEMPLNDPNTFPMSKEHLQELGNDHEKKRRKSDRKKKRRKRKKRRSPSQIMKDSYKQMELRAPPKDIRAKLRLVNTQVKGHFLKKRSLSFKLRQLEKKSISDDAPSQPTSVCIPTNGTKRVSALSSMSVHETASVLYNLIDEAINDASVQEENQEERMKEKAGRGRNGRCSPTYATERKYRSPPCSPRRRRLVPTASTRSGLSSDSSLRRIIEGITYEDIGEEVNVPVSGEVPEREVVSEERKLRVLGKHSSLHGSELLREAATLQARIHRLRHVNPAA